MVALAIVFSLPHVKPQAQYTLSIPNIKQVLTAGLLRLDFSVFTLHLILTCAFIVMPVLLVENNIVALDLKDNWKMYLPVMLVSFVGMLPMIILAEKYHKHKAMLLTAITIMIMSQILFYQTPLNYTTFFILLTLFFIAFNAMEAMLPSLISKTANTDKRGLAMGLYSTSQFLGAFIGGVFGGWIYNTYDLNSVFLFTTFMAIIWWGVILTMKQQNQPGE
jgi:predicted MFS family arabinose efflux permease